MMTMCHPDGEISFFNDSALGIAPSPKKIESYANRLGFQFAHPSHGISTLPDSGYVRLQNESVTLLADVAKVGPDYLPGHAHADTLSFELSVNGNRVICNSGTSVYGESDERHRQRSTQAHSTAVINKTNSSDVWRGFRVARRAYPIDVDFKQTTDSHLQVAASHDGYTRLSGAPVHRRMWEVHSDTVVINDSFLGKEVQNIDIFFHLAPEWTAKLAGNNKISAKSINGGQLQMMFESPSETDVAIEKSTWHPEFGVSIPNWRLRVTLSGELPQMLRSSVKWNV
jgi:uncharacterized heparinase superfamily protein